MRRGVSIAAIAAATWVGAGLPASPQARPAACATTPVGYAPAKHALGESPWALAQPASAGVAAFLASYTETLHDARVNRSDGLVLWQTGTQIVWHSAGRLPTRGTLTARRLDGPGAFAVRLSDRGRDALSAIRFPAPGCWRLTFRRPQIEASIVARVVAPADGDRCDATPVDGPLAVTRPRSAGIAGGWTWRTPGGAALMYTHGKGPGDLNAKVLWWARRGAGPTIQLAGTQLDGGRVFWQQFSQAGNPSSRPAGYETIFPSIVDVPAPGCWLLRLRTGRLAGVVVVHAIDR